ncbi:TRAP transporter small permease [Paracoccus sp. (in: a-proteobacteria)]|uniref:TRAP transporter small permease n=1 Tax=Paracoccus sp. TaxID=267 RepID=UPI003A8498FB
MTARGLARGLARLIDLAAGTAMLAMILLTFVDVVGRYGFHKSVFGASEMIEWLMVLVVFGGLARVTAAGTHIRMSMFDRFTGRAGPATAAWFSLLASALLAVALWVLAADAWVSGRGTAVLGLPVWIYTGGALVLTLIGLLLLIVTMTTPEPPETNP